jgi:hypothetical protein
MFWCVFFLICCANNIFYRQKKVWLGCARTELLAGNETRARQLIRRALEEVPSKSRTLVLLDYARLEEFSGHVDDAISLLTHGCTEAKCGPRC